MSCDTAPFGLGMQPSHSVLGLLRNQLLNFFANTVLMRDVQVRLDQVRASVGLAPKGQDFFTAALSPFLYLQGTTPSFEYPRRDLPAQVHFVGTFLPPAPTDFVLPDWWQELQGELPVVHVTQGTVATEASDLIAPTIQALADEAVLVIVTTGGQPLDHLKLQAMPANVRVEPFIPHAYLLPHVDVMVTNGGFNGVQIALANGVPMVTAGQTEEKPEICARVQWTGTGIDLKTSNPQRLQREIHSYDAPAIATALLETLAATKQPVLRSHDSLKIDLL